MNTTLDTTAVDDAITRRARRRVGQKVGFFVHLLVFVLVNAGLALLSLSYGRSNWHLWPLAGWSLGLAIHGIVTFVGLNSDGLRERLVASEIERLKRR